MHRNANKTKLNILKSHVINSCACIVISNWVLLYSGTRAYYTFLVYIPLFVTLKYSINVNSPCNHTNETYRQNVLFPLSPTAGT